MSWRKENLKTALKKKKKSLKVAPKINWKKMVLKKLGDNDSEKLEFEEDGPERMLRKALRVRRFR